MRGDLLKCVAFDWRLRRGELCFALVAGHRRHEAEEVLRELLDPSATSYVKEYFVAMAHVALGNQDEAFDLLAKASAEKDPWLVWLGTERDSLYCEAILLLLRASARLIIQWRWVDCGVRQLVGALKKRWQVTALQSQLSNGHLLLNSSIVPL